MRQVTGLLAALVASIYSISSAAVTLIPATNRVDMVHDAKRGLVYVTNADQLIRYDVARGTTLPPLSIGGNLSGIDLSPDGNTLVIADQADTADVSWVHMIDLDTLSRTQILLLKTDSLEGGTFTAVYGADGNVYLTSFFHGSGWVPFRRLDPATGSWTELASVRQNTMLSASGDTQTIAFAEANISDGAWGLYDVPTGQIVRREGYTDGTSWSNYEIATDRLGTQFSIPTYGGTFVYDDMYKKIGTLGVYAGELPIGVAYHPVEQIAYFPWAQTSEVRVYDMNTLTQIGTYSYFADQFRWNGDWAFQQGRTRLSRDGSLLMVSVTGGVWLQQQYAPLSAADVSGVTIQQQSVDIALQGSIGNNGALSYEIIASPAHGTALLNGNVATYTPAGTFQGGDSFRYRVHYGRAIADANAVISVGQPNHAPVASSAALTTNEDTSTGVALQASDADGDVLTYSILTQPLHGTLSGSGSARVYTPAANYNGPDSFTFTANDGQASSNIATINIQVASVNDAPVAYSIAAINTNEDTSVSVALQASDVDGDSLTYTIVGPPQHGTLSGAGSNRTYTPAANFNGADSFTFQVNDGQASSNVATVNIVVASVNDAPVARADSAFTTRNAPVTIAVLANDSDVDGDVLTISSVTAPAHGTAAISNGRIAYTPINGFVGADQFSYTITDGHGASATATVSVSVLKK